MKKIIDFCIIGFDITMLICAIAKILFDIADGEDVGYVVFFVVCFTLDLIRRLVKRKANKTGDSSQS